MKGISPLISGIDTPVAVCMFYITIEAGHPFSSSIQIFNSSIFLSFFYPAVLLFHQL